MSQPPLFVVRRAVAGDAAAVMDCLRAAFEPYRELYTPAAYEDTVLTPATAAERFAAMAVFVAETLGGEIVGTVAGNVVGSGEGHLRGMAVRPEWQGRAVADALLAAAESALRRAGCDRVSLDTTRHLGRAIRFYEAHGYRPSGGVGDFFGMELIEYVKPLGATGAGPGGWVARRAGPGDVEVLARLRVEFLTEIGDADAGAASDPLRAYFARAIPAGEFVGWVAEAGGEVVGTGGLCFAEKPGTGRNPSGREGYVLNMYTRPAWRGRGIAAALLKELLAEAAARGVGCVRLHATAAGRPLYERSGFRPSDTEMVLYTPEAARPGSEDRTGPG